MRRAVRHRTEARSPANPRSAACSVSRSRGGVTIVVASTATEEAPDPEAVRRRTEACSLADRKACVRRRTEFLFGGGPEGVRWRTDACSLANRCLFAGEPMLVRWRTDVCSVANRSVFAGEHTARRRFFLGGGGAGFDGERAAREKGPPPRRRSCCRFDVRAVVGFAIRRVSWGASSLQAPGSLRRSSR
jgi:hypothetical protein